MSVFDDLCSVAGVRYNNALFNKDILDAFLLRRARQRGIRLPSGTEPDRINFFGAHVAVPKAGLSQNAVYLDLASLYPNIMRAVNLSPETLIGTEDALEESEYDHDDVVHSYIDPRPVKWTSDDEHYSEFTDGEYKMVYDPNAPKVRWTGDPQYRKCYFAAPWVKEGFVASTVDELLELKNQYTGARYEAIKRVVNSVFGFCSFANRNTASRIYDWRLGEAITLAGRKVIQHTADRAVTRLHGRGYTDVQSVGGDTDSTVVSLPSADSYDDCMDDVCKVADAINEEDYPKFMSETFGVEPDAHHMEVEAESFARRLFVPAETPSVHDPDVGSKKRYAQLIQLEDTSLGDAAEVYGSDGSPMGYETVTEIDITGMEYVRSDVAEATRRVQKEVLDVLLRCGSEGRAKAFETARGYYDGAKTGAIPLSDLAKRGGIGQPLSEYGSPRRRPSPIYRGAKYADKHLDVELSEGDKPLCYYITGTGRFPSVYDTDTAENGDVVDAVALPQGTPLPDDFTPNREKHVQKAIVEPLEPILETMNWSWSDVKAGSVDTQLSKFM